MRLQPQGNLVAQTKAIQPSESSAMAIVIVELRHAGVDPQSLEPVFFVRYSILQYPPPPLPNMFGFAFVLCLCFPYSSLVCFRYVRADLFKKRRGVS
jgi:hypothetical protein